MNESYDCPSHLHRGDEWGTRFNHSLMTKFSDFLLLFRCLSFDYMTFSIHWKKRGPLIFTSEALA